MADGNFLQKGVAIVKSAVDADNEQKYHEALGLYKQALGYFMTAVKWEKNTKTKETIREKIKEYMNRAEQIKDMLDEKQNPAPKKKVVKAGGAGGAAKKKNTTGDNKGGDDNKDSDDEDLDPETAKLQAAISQAIVMEKPNVKWDDVAGLEQAKSLLKEAVILPIKFPQLFTGKRQPWRGILLYGPPGTGKSYLAKAVATEAGASTFLSVSSSDLVSKFLGESERLVRNLFEIARQKKPAIIFIDEIDSLCSQRSDNENDSARRIKTEFLVQMQGVGKGNDGVLVLGATNTPWELDPAIRRRFEKRVYISLPEKIARVRMFQIHIGDTPHTLTDENFETLGERTDGFSGSDISAVVKEALYEPVRTCQISTHFKKVMDGKDANDWHYVPCPPYEQDAEEIDLMSIDDGRLKPLAVSMEDFERVLRIAKPTVGPEDLVRQEEWTKMYGQEG